MRFAVGTPVSDFLGDSRARFFVRVDNGMGGFDDHGQIPASALKTLYGDFRIIAYSVVCSSRRYLYLSRPPRLG